MKIRKRLTIEISVDKLNRKHCAHTETKSILNLCTYGLDYDEVQLCILFDSILKRNHRDYPIRCDKCLKKFGVEVSNEV